MSTRLDFICLKLGHSGKFKVPRVEARLLRAGSCQLEGLPAAARSSSSLGLHGPALYQGSFCCVREGHAILPSELLCDVIFVQNYLQRYLWRLSRRGEDRGHNLALGHSDLVV